MEGGSSDVGESTLARESPRRRRKTVWEAWHQEALLAAFAKDPYPSFRDRQEVASQVGLPESRIRVWFQNRRSRTRLVRQGPERGAGHSGLASPQQRRPQEPGARALVRGPPAGRRRPRTRFNSEQLTILLQAFGNNPLPDIDAREELARRTALPEDTVHIWFQNRRARHPGAAGAAPRAGQEDNDDDNDDYDDIDDALASPAPNEETGGPAGGGETQPAQAEPQQEAVASNTCCPVELFLDRLLTELEADPQDALDPEDQWEQIDPTLTPPLDQEEYQALLDLL